MNMNLSDPRTIGPRIRMMMPHLTPLEARVVDTMLGRRDFDETTSLKEVAEDAGVSEAMVVKIAKKLGFAGFRDFRAGAGRLQQPADAPTCTRSSRRTTARPRSSRRSSAPRCRRSRRRCRSSMPKAFERAADLYLTGRASATSTASAARRRSPATSRTSSCGSASATSVFDDAHMMLMSASLLGPEDVVIGFSPFGHDHRRHRAAGARPPAAAPAASP